MLVLALQFSRITHARRSTSDLQLTTGLDAKASVPGAEGNSLKTEEKITDWHSGNDERETCDHRSM
jgi:hypothetical protein